MSLEKFSIVKLSGSNNYPLWAIRMKAYLTKAGYSDILTTNEVTEEINKNASADIQLCLEDGPLVQVHTIDRAHTTWLSLQNLYSPKGFSSEFLTLREFFSCKLSKFASMEEYLNKVKQLTNDLESKEIILPNQVIIAWVLNNLTSEYNSIISNITQSLRNDRKSYDLESLFSTLIDESKRQTTLTEHEVALFANTNNGQKHKPTKHFKPYKITKPKFCRNCKKTSHNANDCYFLFPHKAPKEWRCRPTTTHNKPREMKSYENNNNNTNTADPEVWNAAKFFTDKNTGRQKMTLRTPSNLHQNLTRAQSSIAMRIRTEHIGL
ncbi:hypothetical protein K3495_g12704 [Podosphaera aphanis]|nr:hypothetical protein K3495_g12704 [Podosphaera aphanis]